jgi:hypothetical protein
MEFSETCFRFSDSLTFWDYSGFGTKLRPVFGFVTRAIANRRSKSSKYKTNFPLSQLPKSIVVDVSCSTYFVSVNVFIHNFSKSGYMKSLSIIIILAISGISDLFIS